jgi:putative acetyltransferase
MVEAGYSIRLAKIEDAARICSLHVDSIRRLDGPFYTAAEIEGWTVGKKPGLYEQMIAEGKTLTFVAALPDQILGFSSILGDEVTSVYVSPDHARRGLGKKLYEVLEANARTAGQTKLKLSSSRQAEPFYLHLGFKRISEKPYHLSSGVLLPALQMEKELS